MELHEDEFYEYGEEKVTIRAFEDHVFPFKNGIQDSPL
jgi:hypothetical protein